MERSRARFVAERLVISRGSGGELLVTAHPQPVKKPCLVEVIWDLVDRDKRPSPGGSPGVGHYARVLPHDDDPPYSVGCSGGTDGQGGGCTLHFEVDNGSVTYWCE
jgi:hypothetical protein